MLSPGMKFRAGKRVLGRKVLPLGGWSESLGQTWLEAWRGFVTRGLCAPALGPASCEPPRRWEHQPLGAEWDGKFDSSVVESYRRTAMFNKSWSIGNLCCVMLWISCNDSYTLPSNLLIVLNPTLRNIQSLFKGFKVIESLRYIWKGCCGD